MELTPPPTPAPLVSHLNQVPSTSPPVLVSHIFPFPGPETLEAFGVEGEVVPLPGRSKKSFRVSDVVLKHVNDPIEAEWTSQLLAALACLISVDFEVPTPLEATNGQAVFQGWTAFQFMTGKAGPKEKWKELIDLSRAFHEALFRVRQPGFLPERKHPWAVADRVAWGEASIHIRYPMRDVYNEFINLRRDVSVAHQVINGDLAANVLFRDGMSPVILSFTPYWRPAAYADALIIADGLLLGEQDMLIFWLGENAWTRLQMLIRALIFRIAITNVRKDQPTGEEAKEYVRVLEIVKAGLRADPNFGR